MYNSCAVKDTNSITDSNLQTNQHLLNTRLCATSLHSRTKYIQAHQLKHEYEYNATQAIFGSDHSSHYTQTMYNGYGSKIVLLGNDHYTDS